ncbi:uncharacterized protein METZ01_LOCUS295673 [marine metagenome]|uniref:Tyrosine specific protein phosphatases domain-containing protein n=1 Tax=marine metagenome TaxID=408172 RepID=A0A382M1J7_9ZZZZ
MPTHLNFPDAYNVRDIGGYLTNTGTITRYKKFVRSGTLHLFSKNSRERLELYGIKTVIDLRQNYEVEEKPDVFHDSKSVNYIHINMIGDGPVEAFYNQGNETIDSVSRMYIFWLENRKSQIKEVLSIMADSTSHTTLFHCNGGKDRVGIISSLLLAISDVPTMTIAEDYTLSGKFLMKRFFDEQAPPNINTQNYTWVDYQHDFCPVEAMLKVHEHLHRKYGSVLNYIDSIGIQRNKVNSIKSALSGSI